MELAVYFANLDDLLDIEEVLHPLDATRIPDFLKAVVFPDDASSEEYQYHLTAVGWLNERLSEGEQVSRLYFGHEFCEYLIPGPEEVEQAFFFAQQLGWAFTYVTGYVTEAGLHRIAQNIKLLAGMEQATEVVVNDWGVLALMRREYPQIQPVLGRLLTKQMRMGRYTRSLPPVDLHDIETPGEEIARNQVSVFRALNLSIPEYRAQLKRLGVQRLDLDIAPQSVELPADGWGLAFSCYYPWGYVTGGRNCLTAGMADPAREFVVLDTPCPRPCRRFNRAAFTHNFADATIQRGNTVFLYHGDDARPYLLAELPISRIVFEPYIPI